MGAGGRGADPMKDFTSFDILWFDLSTKVRELVLEMTEPLNDKLFNYKDLIDQQTRYLDDQQKKLDELDKVIFNRAEDLDIFQNIDKRITAIDVDRKDKENKLETDIGICLKTFEEYTFKFEQNEKVFK